MSRGLYGTGQTSAWCWCELGEPLKVRALEDVFRSLGMRPQRRPCNLTPTSFSLSLWGEQPGPATGALLDVMSHPGNKDRCSAAEASGTVSRAIPFFFKNQFVRHLLPLRNSESYWDCIWTHNAFCCYDRKGTWMMSPSSKALANVWVNIT